MVCFEKPIAILSWLLVLTGCASSGGSGSDNYNTINGGDSTQEVRPDIFFIIAKSGFYIPDTASPLLAIERLVIKNISGQGPVAANKRWQDRANILCGAGEYRVYKKETYSESANTGPYSRWIAVESAYAVCNRKNYSEEDIRTMFPYW